MPGFALTERVRGYWDRRDTEIDFVALDERQRIVRLCNVKRSAAKLLASERGFLTNVDRFLDAFPYLREWRVERAMVTTALETSQRDELVRRGYHAEDLQDLLPPLPA